MVGRPSIPPHRQGVAHGIVRAARAREAAAAARAHQTPALLDRCSVSRPNRETPGSKSGDQLTGNDSANVLTGGLGGDELDGLGGDDTLNAAPATTDLDGGPGLAHHLAPVERSIPGRRARQPCLALRVETIGRRRQAGAIVALPPVATSPDRPTITGDRRRDARRPAREQGLGLGDRRRGLRRVARASGARPRPAPR